MQTGLLELFITKSTLVNFEQKHTDVRMYKCVHTLA